MSRPGRLRVPGPAGPAWRPELAAPPQNSGAGGKPLRPCFLLPRLRRGQAPEAPLPGFRVDLPPGEREIQGSGPDERWGRRLFTVPANKIDFRFARFIIFLRREGLTFDWTLATVKVGVLKGIPDPLKGAKSSTSGGHVRAYNYHITYDFFSHPAMVMRPTQLFRCRFSDAKCTSSYLYFTVR